MQYHILQTNIIRIVQQTVRSTTNEILGLKGLRIVFTLDRFLLKQPRHTPTVLITWLADLRKFPMDSFLSF